MSSILVVLHFLICVALIVLVILQQGKGADMGAAFGSGNASSVLGGSSVTFLTKLTAWLAIGFFVSSILLGQMMAKQTPVMPKVPVSQQ